MKRNFDDYSKKKKKKKKIKMFKVKVNYLMFTDVMLTHIITHI